MITLYDYLPSQNAWKIRCLIQQTGQAYTQQFISIFEGEGRSEEYRRINPTGAVPAIKLDDGSFLAESNAILVHLAQGSDYFPTNPVEQMKVHQWLFFESDYVQNSIATLRHWVLTKKDRKRSEEMLNSKVLASERTLSVLNEHLGRHVFLIGDQYTIADISNYAYVHLADDANMSLSHYPNVQRWIEAVRSQPRYLNEIFPYSIDPFSENEL